MTLWDQHFEHPRQSFASPARVRPTVQVGAAEHVLGLANDPGLKIYEYPGGYAKRFDGIGPEGARRDSKLYDLVRDDGARTAALRREAEIWPGLFIRGAGNLALFAAGHKFRLRDHFDANGSYVVLSLDHLASIEGSYTTQKKDQLRSVYQNRFECLPLVLPYRPPLATRKPVIQGPQTATVVGLVNREENALPGPADDPPDLLIDPYGRVKVQFHWDREHHFNSDSSCWVRVGQDWAGNRWGAFFWPRPGHEVIVAFEDGDPDRPIIVGSVYNQHNMPPLELPARRTVCGIKSLSIGGDPMKHFNSVMFYDQPGKKHVVVHSETMAAETARQFYVPGTQSNVVGNLMLVASMAAKMGGSGSGGGSVGETIHGWADAAYDWGETNIYDMVLNPLSSYYCGLFPGNFALVNGNDNYSLIGGKRSASMITSDLRYTWDLFGTAIKSLKEVSGTVQKLRGKVPTPPGTGLGKGALADAILFGIGGIADLLIADQSAILYGESVSIQRGRKFELQEDFFWTSTGKLIKLLAILTTLAATGSSLLASIFREKAEMYEGLFGLQGTFGGFWGGLAGKCWAILHLLEAQAAKLKMAEKEAAEALKQTKMVANLAAAIVPAAVGTAQRKIQRSLGFVAETDDSLIEPINLFHVDHAVKGPYAVHAADITLRSEKVLQSLEDLAAGASTATTITLSAEGGGDAKEDRALTLHATKQAIVSTGTAGNSASLMSGLLPPHD